MPPPWSSFQRFHRKSAPAFLNPQTWTRRLQITILPGNSTNSCLGNILFVGKVFVVGHVFVSYIGGVGSTTGISMVPTIPHSFRSHPWILYSSLHRRGRNIQVGDVITYTHPMFPTEHGCKRVIGMPGDFVSVITPGRRDGDIEADDVDGKWASVKGHCWVQGDNLEWSRDSRLFGPLPLGLVKSKVLAVILPFREAKWVGSSVDLVKPQERGREWVMK
jgi:inner membrane protease subunit 1